jgi:RNA polymerase sigma-70 factor (TIGR02954 family)
LAKGQIKWYGGENMSEEELVIAAQSGDKEAFYKLMSLYSKSLYKIAYSYLESQQEALEAVQETTCRAFVKLRKVKQPQYFKTWVTKVVINYCIDELKRGKKLTELNTEEQIEDTTSRVDNLDLEAAINKLDSRYKQVIVLKYFQDMTTEDIANVLERPEGTIKTWLHRGLNSLRSYFKKDGDLNV